jgi:diguanylate cyclase (GGDEF)-like protein
MTITLPRIHKYSVKRSQPATLYISFLLVAFVAVLDYLTGPEVSLSFFYLIPIAFGTWYVNEKTGSLVTYLSVCAFILSDWAAGEIYSREIIRYLNGFMRVTIFMLVIWLLKEYKRALAHERLLARTDSLTGLANHREFYQQAQAELQRASRSNRPFSLAYIDLDGFKQVNDRMGHRTGNALLRTTAQAFKATIRRTDILARLGGDEFAILLPNTGQTGAKSIMQRLQAAFLRQMVESQTSVTLSAGVISFTSLPVSVEEMIHQVDCLMYQAKAQGKNDILFWES